jgi:hypothetical protein
MKMTTTFGGAATTDVAHASDRSAMTAAHNTIRIRESPLLLIECANERIGRLAFGVTLSSRDHTAVTRVRTETRCGRVPSSGAIRAEVEVALGVGLAEGGHLAVRPPFIRGVREEDHQSIDRRRFERFAFVEKDHRGLFSQPASRGRRRCGLSDGSAFIV